VGRVVGGRAAGSMISYLRVMSPWARLCPGSLFASENNRNNFQLERRHVNKLSGTEVKVVL